MTSDRPPRATGNQGSSPVGAAPQRSRGKLIGLIVAAVVLLVLLALLLSQCGGSDDDATGTAAGSSSAGGSASTASASSDGESTASSSGTASSAASSAATSAPATSAAPAAGAPGTVTAGGQSLLDAAGSADPATALAALSGQPATATAVQVLSVPADEGFWVGSSDAARVWVQLTGTGESGYQVVEGDTVDFAGTLVAHDASFAGTVGVDEAEGAAQLTTQAQHVEVARDAVTLSA